MEDRPSRVSRFAREWSVADRTRQSYSEILRELLVSGASAYPLAVSASVAYWSELAASASSYYGDVLEVLIAALRNPRHGGAILADLAPRFKKHLVQLGDITERTVLELNARLEAGLRRPPDAASTPGGAGDEHIADILRGIADVAMKQAWTLQESQARPDLHALGEELERLLREIRGLEREAATARPDSGSSASTPPSA